MKIYNKSGSKIEVYSMCPDMTKMKLYKNHEMGYINEDARILRARENTCGYVGLLEDNLYDIINVEHLNGHRKLPFDGGHRFHELSQYDFNEEEKLRQRKILLKYYKGDYKECKIKQVGVSERSTDKEFISSYLLLTKSNYSFSTDSRHTMDDIISLPKSLFLLHFLENGKFPELINEDIEHQLNLFDIELTDVVSIDQMKRIHDTGLLSDELDASMKKVDMTQKIFSKVNKQNIIYK